MKLKRLIATAGLAAVLAIGVGTGITINREAERVDAAAPTWEVGDKLELVNSTADFDLTGNYVIGCRGKSVLMGANSGTYYANVSAPNLTTTSKSTDLLDGVTILSVTKGTKDTSAYVFKNIANDKIVYHSGSSNDLYEGTEPVNGEWKVTITNGSANIENTVSKKKSNFRKIRYNDGATRFTTYGSGQEDIELYRCVKNTDPSILITDTTAITAFTGQPDTTFSTTISNFTNADKVTYEWTVTSATNAFSIVGAANEASVKLHFEKEGTGTIKVVAKDATVSPVQTAQVEIGVTVSKAYTVTEAKTLAKDTVTLIKGIISGNNGKHTFIADKDGTGLKLDSLLNAKFSTGDEVVVKGKIADSFGATIVRAASFVGEAISKNNVITPKVLKASELGNPTYGDFVKLEGMVSMDKSLTTNAKPDYNFNSEFKSIRNKVADKSTLVAVRFENNGNNVDNLPNIVKDLSAHKDDKVAAYDIAGISQQYQSTKQIMITDTTVIMYNKLATLSGMLFPVDGDTKNQCKTLFNETRTFVLSLTAEELNTFKTDATYADALSRYVAWSASLNENAWTEAATTNAIENFDNTTLLITIISISILSVSSIALLVIFKRKRLTR